MTKEKARKADTAYWCTCSDDPATCLGCAIDKLVAQVLGTAGTRFLNVRTFKMIKPETKK